MQQPQPFLATHCAVPCRPGHRAPQHTHEATGLVSSRAATSPFFSSGPQRSSSSSMVQPGRSAFTASVWGNRRAALVASRELREGEEECAICREETPATVALQPCNHNVCIACVETMRATNIYRVRAAASCTALCRPCPAGAGSAWLGSDACCVMLSSADTEDARTQMQCR